MNSSMSRIRQAELVFVFVLVVVVVLLLLLLLSDKNPNLVSCMSRVAMKRQIHVEMETERRGEERTDEYPYKQRRVYTNCVGSEHKRDFPGNEDAGFPTFPILLLDSESSLVNAVVSPDTISSHLSQDDPVVHEGDLGTPFSPILCGFGRQEQLVESSTPVSSSSAEEEDETDYLLRQRLDFLKTSVCDAIGSDAVAEKSPYLNYPLVMNGNGNLAMNNNGSSNNVKLCSAELNTILYTNRADRRKKYRRYRQRGLKFTQKQDSQPPPPPPLSCPKLKPPVGFGNRPSFLVPDTPDVTSSRRGFAKYCPLDDALTSMDEKTKDEIFDSFGPQKLCFAPVYGSLRTPLKSGFPHTVGPNRSSLNFSLVFAIPHAQQVDWVADVTLFCESFGLSQQVPIVFRKDIKTSVQRRMFGKTKAELSFVCVDVNYMIECHKNKTGQKCVYMPVFHFEISLASEALKHEIVIQTPSFCHNSR